MAARGREPKSGASSSPGLRLVLLGVAALASWRGASSLPFALRSPVPGAAAAAARLSTGQRCVMVSHSVCGGERVSFVVMGAAKKAAGGGSPVCDGDTVYIKVSTGKYIGELDGTSRKEWVKARGTKKDQDHALTIEKAGGGEVESGDIVKLVMPLSQTNGTKIHMDVVGSAVRARHYDARGEWQKMTIIKQDGGVIQDGDKIFLRSVFMNGRDYLDANPLEKSPDGELKCRWPDEGDWQVMTIEK